MALPFPVRTMLACLAAVFLLAVGPRVHGAGSHHPWQVFAAFADDGGVITVATALEGSLRHHCEHSPISTPALANYLRSPVAVDDGRGGVVLAALAPDWELVAVTDQITIEAAPPGCTAGALAAGLKPGMLTIVRGGEYGLTIRDWSTNTGLGEAREFAVTPAAVTAHRSSRLCVWVVDGHDRIWFLGSDGDGVTIELRGQIAPGQGEWILDSLADGSALVWTESGRTYVFPEDGSPTLSWSLRPGLRSVHGWRTDGQFVIVAATAREWTWMTSGGQCADGWEPFTDPVELLRASKGGVVSAVTRSGTVHRLTVGR